MNEKKSWLCGVLVESSHIISYHTSGPYGGMGIGMGIGTYLSTYRGQAGWRCRWICLGLVWVGWDCLWISIYLSVFVSCRVE